VDQLGRDGHIAEAPAGHRVGLREGEGGRDAWIVGRDGGRTGPRPVEKDLVVALVAEQPHVVALRQLDQGGDRFEWIDRAGRIVRAVDHEDLAARGDESFERLEVRLKAGRRWTWVIDAAR